MNWPDTSGSCIPHPPSTYSSARSVPCHRSPQWSLNERYDVDPHPTAAVINGGMEAQLVEIPCVGTSPLLHGTNVTENRSTNQEISNIHLVGGLEHFLFFHILGIITPTD